MSLNLEFNYAVINRITFQCVNVCTYAVAVNRDNYIPIDTLDWGYIDKYYINGSWYEDAQGTIPWSPTE